MLFRAFSVSDSCSGRALHRHACKLLNTTSISSRPPFEKCVSSSAMSQFPRTLVSSLRLQDVSHAYSTCTLTPGLAHLSGGGDAKKQHWVTRDTRLGGRKCVPSTAIRYNGAKTRNRKKKTKNRKTHHENHPDTGISELVRDNGKKTRKRRH